MKGWGGRHQLTLWYDITALGEAVRLKASTENGILYVEQGKTFDVSLECVDENGKVTLGMLL